MARPQVEEIPRFPRLMPAAGPVQGFAGGAQPSATLGALTQSVLRYGERARNLLFDLEGQRQQKLLATTRAEMAASPELVDQLLDEVPEDEDSQREALQMAERRGLISDADNPFTTIALLEAESRRAGERAMLATTTRLRSGEHLPHEDENGNPVPGTPFGQIVDEELAKYRENPALKSELGALAFEQVVSSQRPGLEHQAQAGIDNANRERFVSTIQDELSGLVRRASDADDAELQAVMFEMEARADEMRRGNVPDYELAATDALLRGVSSLADVDPTRALELLNVTLPDLKVGGRTLDENPRTEEQLINARHRLRAQSDYDEELDNRQQTRREKEQLRSVEDFLSAHTRELREGSGAGPAEIRRRGQSALQAFITTGPQAGEFAENAELLRREGLKTLDALLAESATSNPGVVQEMQTQVALARTPEELTELESEARSLAGTDLVGSHLDQILNVIGDRRASLGIGGVSSNPSYTRALGALADQQAPKGMTLHRRTALERVLREIDTEFSAEVDRATRAAGGRPNEAEIERLGREAAARKRELTELAEADVGTALSDARQSIYDGMGPSAVRDKYADKLDQEVINDLAGEAEKREGYILDLEQDDAVRAQARGLMAATLNQLDENDPLSIVEVETQLNREIGSVIRESLKGRPFTLNEARGIASAAVQDFALKRAAELRASQRAEAARAAEPGAEAAADAQGPATLFVGGEEESAETDPTVRAAAQRQAERLAADFTSATEILGGGRRATMANSPELARLVPTAPHGGFLNAQDQAFVDDPNMGTAPSLAVNWLEGEVAREIRGGAKNGSQLYVAAMSPVGIPIAQLVEGKATIKAGSYRVTLPPSLLRLTFTREMVNRQELRLREPIEIKLKPEDVPPFTTRMFDSVAELKKFWDTQGEDLDRLFKVWGIDTPTAEQLWGDTQSRLIERFRAAEFRTSKFQPPPISREDL